MIVLSKEQIIYLHEELIKETGGLQGLKDEGLLDSALAAPFQTFENQELFPSICHKAARLGFGLASNHAFIDGNKRIGAHAMLVFLELNSIHISYTQEELSEEKFLEDLKNIKTDEFNTSLSEDAIRLSPNLADGLSFNECVFAMCCLFEMRGIYNIKIAVNNSVPINYDQNLLYPEDLRALIVSEENKEDLRKVMSVYNKHRFGAITICSLDKENTKRIHLTLFPEEIYEDLMKSLPQFGDNRLLVQFDNCSREEIIIFLKVWEIKFKEKMLS